MRKTTKYLTIGALVVGAFMFWLLGDDSTENMDQSAGASGNEYQFTTDDGSVVGVKIPKCIGDGDINLTDKKEEKVFRAIFNYGNSDGDVYVREIPDDEETFREILKDSSSVGSLFNFTVELQGAPDGSGLLYGDVQGDYSIENFMYIDSSYLGDEKYNIMDGDMASFDVVYVGMDGSDPTFVALEMFE